MDMNWNGSHFLTESGIVKHKLIAKMVHAEFQGFNTGSLDPSDMILGRDGNQHSTTCTEKSGRGGGGFL